MQDDIVAVGSFPPSKKLEAKIQWELTYLNMLEPEGVCIAEIFNYCMVGNFAGTNFRKIGQNSGFRNFCGFNFHDR